MRFQRAPWQGVMYTEGELNDKAFKAVVVLKDHLCDDIDWRTKFTWGGSIPEFKFMGEYVYKAPTLNSIYLFVSFLIFSSAGVVIQEWSNLSDVVLSLLSTLFL